MALVQNTTRANRQSALTLTGVEGWRGIAALLVVLGHVWTNMGRDGSGYGPGYRTSPVIGWTMGNLDAVVDLFFILSGMLIWLPFGAAAFDDRAEIPRGGVFLLRRVMRFLPLYIVVVLLQWTRHNYGFSYANYPDLLEHLTLTQSLDSGRIFYTIGPAWTLSVEWFFYLSMAFIAPSFIRWIRRSRSGRGRFVRFLAGTLPVLGGSLYYKHWVALHIPETQWAWRFGPAAKADIFIVGMYFGTAVLALRGRKLPGWMLPFIVAASVAAGAAVLVPPGLDHNIHDQVFRHVVTSFAFGLLLFGLSTSKWQLPARLIDNRLLMPLSVLAYSIYILHEAVLEWVQQLGWFTYNPSVSGFCYNFVLVVLVTLPVAYFFHRAIEVPWAEVTWLVNRDGSARELYPHLLDAPAPTTSLLSRYIDHVDRGDHIDPGEPGHAPSAAMTAVVERLSRGARVRQVEGV